MLTLIVVLGAVLLLALLVFACAMAMLFRAALRHGHVPTITHAAPAQLSRPVGAPVEADQLFAWCSYGRGCYGACCMRPDHLSCIHFRDPLDHIDPTLLSDNYWP